MSAKRMGRHEAFGPQRVRHPPLAHVVVRAAPCLDRADTAGTRRVVHEEKARPGKEAPAPANMQRVVRSMRRAAAWLRPSCFLPSCFAAFRMRRRSGAGIGRRHALDGMGRRVRPHGSRQGDAIGAGRACRKLLPVHHLGAFAHGRPRSRLCCVVHRVDLLARLRAKGWCIAERAGLLRAVAIAWRNAFFEGEGPARKRRAFERRSPFGKRSRPTGGSGIERRPETRRRRTRCPSDGQPAGQGNVGGVEQSPVLCGGHCLRGGHHAYDDAAHQARFGRNGRRGGGGVRDRRRGDTAVRPSEKRIRPISAARHTHPVPHSVPSCGDAVAGSVHRRGKVSSFP